MFHCHSSAENISTTKAWSSDALVSLVGFSFGLFLLPVMLFSTSDWSFLFILSLFYPAVILPLLYLTLKARRQNSSPQKCDGFENAWRAFVLGAVFAIGLFLLFISSTLSAPKRLWPFACYMVVLSFFHWAEFFVTALYNPLRCDVSIYMLTHSPEYIAAACSSALEYWLEVLVVPYLFPNQHYQIPTVINLVGVLLCIGGEVLRKGAMINTANNFNHYVDTVHREDHQLVTNGFYSWFRHPAYVGWFYWAIGTQLLLGNPICLVGFAVAAYRFLSARIIFEEKHLIAFFGQSYREYQKKVGTGIPFAKGYLSVD